MELIEVKQFGKLVGVVDDSEWAGGVRAGSQPTECFSLMRREQLFFHFSSLLTTTMRTTN